MIKHIEQTLKEAKKWIQEGKMHARAHFHIKQVIVKALSSKSMHIWHLWSGTSFDSALSAMPKKYGIAWKGKANIESWKNPLTIYTERIETVICRIWSQHNLRHGIGLRQGGVISVTLIYSIYELYRRMCTSTKEAASGL